MLFNSISFAIFLPIVFSLYWIMPHRFRWGILLIASYFFYMSWNPKYATLILSTTLVSYLAAILIEKKKSRISRKIIIIGSTFFCLGILFFFKYFNFFEETAFAIANLFSIRLHPVTLDLLLPVGISFYTFQTMSYVFDVYKGVAKAERHFGVYATFISFFPQLVAGPIERANNLLPQIRSEKKFDYDLAIYGTRQILWGLFKKIAVADVVAMYVDAAYADLTACSSFDLCIAIFFFTIQIYCDFSGYSDIAIGTAKLFGINLMKNFNSPYFSTSIQEFWSRWHISLSTWFKDYVYITLGGNRCTKLRRYVNITITFLTSGLWHGANWTFVLWGGMHGIALIIEKIFFVNKKNGVKKILLWIIVFSFCNLAWVFFRADSIDDALYVIYNAFGGITHFDGYLHTHIGLSKEKLLFSFATIAIVVIFDFLSLKTDIIQIAATKNKLMVFLIEYFLLAIIGVAVIMGAGAKQFVYFQF